jgi:hypothetical protein
MASFTVSPLLLEQALMMPEGHEIVGANWDFAARTVRLFVEGPDLPQIKEGDMVPSITPMVVRYASGDDDRPAYHWSWNIKASE